MTFKVTKQYARGAESFCKDFSNLKEAKHYVADKLGEEVKMNIQVTYKISEFGEIVAQFDAKNWHEIAKAESASSQGKGSQASFQPTPFNATPRPKGSPQGWVKDKEDEDKK